MPELELITRTYPAQLELRSEPGEGDDAPQRIVSGRLVPYEVRTALPGGGYELLRAGTFKDAQPADVRLYDGTGPLGHGQLIGTATELEHRADGLYGSLRISETRAGDDAYALARDGAYHGFSVGFEPDPATDRIKGDTITRSRGTLRHVALTDTPVYADARVLSVRDTRAGDNAVPEPTVTTEPETAPAPPTPPAPELRSDPSPADLTDAQLTAELERRSAAASDLELRAGTPALGQVTTRARGYAYRSLGELAVDVSSIRMDPASERRAFDRLGALLEHGIVERGREGDTIALRAWATAAAGVGGTTDAAGVYQNTYLPDLLPNLRQERNVANLFAPRPLPPAGGAVTLPRISGGTAIGYQSAEAAALDGAPQATAALQTFNVYALVGGQPVTLQARERTNPDYMNEVILDLIAAYAEKLDSEVINGTGSSAHRGMITAATGVAVGADTLAGFLGKIGTAAASVYAASKRWPRVMIMHPDRWGWLVDQVGTDNRPLVSTEAPQNPIGLGDATAVGTLRGLPVVINESIPQTVNADEDVIFVSSLRDALLYEDQERPAVVSLTYPSTLHTDVSVYGFSAVAIRRDGAFAKITGLTSP